MENTGRRKNQACTECRQQKLRCDASEDYSKPCSRCRRKGLHCEVSKNFQRRKMQTKAMLQTEINRLKEQVQGYASATPFTNDLSNYMTPGPDKAAWNPEASISPHSVPPGPGESPLAHSHVSQTQLRSPPSPTKLPETQPRSLDCKLIDSKTIDECFSLFFRHYSSNLTVLDAVLIPDICYEQSPLLFWTIVTTGARKYQNPTILELLVGRVANLAMSSLSPHEHPLQTIIGLLILCMWPPPVDSVTKELSHIFGGAALLLATQNGLHIYGNGQDFSRTRLIPDVEQRNCSMLEFQRCTKPRRTSLSDGLPPFTVFDHFDSDSESASIISKLPPNLRFLRQIHVIQKEAFKTLVRNFLKPQTANECSALHSLIEMFDSRVLEHRSECSSELDEFTLECARLNIRTFHFFAKADLAEPLGFIELYTLARSVLDHATLLDTTQDFSLYCSQYSIRMTLLAAFVILKISRSHLAHRVDLRGGESSYFSAIHLSKKRSLQNGDLDSRCALILTQLWSSNSIFRRRDGTVDSLRMRTRCRLSVGVVFECFWWWRTEFDGKPNIYSEEGEPQSEDPTIPEAIYDPNLSDIDIYSTVFPDWQWAAGPNFLADFPDGIELGLDNIPAILT